MSEKLCGDGHLTDKWLGNEKFKVCLNACSTYMDQTFNLSVRWGDIIHININHYYLHQKLQAGIELGLNQAVSMELAN